MSEVALPQDLEGICEGRDQAIAAWLALYDGFHKGTAAANALMIGPACAPGARSRGERADCRNSRKPRAQLIHDPQGAIHLR